MLPELCSECTLIFTKNVRQYMLSGIQAPAFPIIQFRKRRGQRLPSIQLHCISLRSIVIRNNRNNGVVACIPCEDVSLKQRLIQIQRTYNKLFRSQLSSGSEKAVSPQTA